MKFRSEKIPRKRLGTVSLILRKKVLIRRATEDSISEALNGRERKYVEKIRIKKQPK